MRRSGVDRDELLVTSKIPGRHHGRQQAIDSTKARSMCWAWTGSIST